MLSRAIWFTVGLALIMTALLGNLGAIIGSIIDPVDMVMGNREFANLPGSPSSGKPQPGKIITCANGNCPPGYNCVGGYCIPSVLAVGGGCPTDTINISGVCVPIPFTPNPASGNCDFGFKVPIPGTNVSICIPT